MKLFTGCPKAQHSCSMINTIDRPYLSWLASGLKTAEGRINSPQYRKMKVEDTISFCDKSTGQYIWGLVRFKREYKSFYDMLKSEGVSNMLPFLKNSEIEKGVEVYNNFPGSERVKRFGCVAIGVSVEKSKLLTEY